MINSFLGIKNDNLQQKELLSYIQSDQNLCEFIKKMSMLTGAFLKESKLDDNFISIPSKYEHYISHIQNFPDSKNKLKETALFLSSENEADMREDLFDRIIDSDGVLDEINDMLCDCSNFLHDLKKSEDVSMDDIISSRAFFNIVNSSSEVNSQLSEILINSFTQNSEKIVNNIEKFSYNDIANITLENSKIMNTVKHLGQIVMTSECVIEIDQNYCKSNLKNEIDSFFSSYINDYSDSSQKFYYSGFNPETRTANVFFYTATKNLENEALEIAKEMCHNLKKCIAFTDKNLNDVIKKVYFSEITPTLKEANWHYLSAPNKEARNMIRKSEEFRIKAVCRGRNNEGPSI